MDEDEVRAVIRLILEIIEEMARPKRALVLFTGAWLGFDHALAALVRLKADGLAMTVVQTPAAERLLDQTRIAALGLPAPTHGLVSGHDLLIIPSCTANTVAKVAHGIADTLATNLISEFIACGKPVIAAGTAADPDSPDKRAVFPLMPAAQAAVLRENLARVKSMGVQFCEAADLAECVGRTKGTVPFVRTADRPDKRNRPLCPDDTPPRLGEASEPSPLSHPGRLVAAHHIQTLPPGSVLSVRRDAIVTALAADLARSRLVRIERA